MWVRGGGWQGVGSGRSSARPLTIIVDAAIVVLVAVLHELLNVVLCDGLASSLKHHLQLVQVNVAISVSAGSGGKVSGPLVGAKEGKRQPHPRPREGGRQSRAAGR